MEFNPFLGKKHEKLDYNDLINKPSINGVTLTNNLNSLDLNIAGSHTTAEWNANPSLISKKDMIYIYTDYYTDGLGNVIPGMKIGDGNAYLIDIPFMSFDSVTIEEKTYWNNKITAFINENDEENLVLSKD